jgi:hypothetical protein
MRVKSGVGRTHTHSVIPGELSALGLPRTTEQANDSFGFAALSFMEDGMIAPSSSPVSLLYHYADLVDPRSDHTKLHTWSVLLAMST